MCDSDVLVLTTDHVTAGVKCRMDPSGKYCTIIPMFDTNSSVSAQDGIVGLGKASSHSAR